MTTYNNELTIDLGAVGYRNDQEPFRVRLHANKLQKLIEDAFNVHRVYELMLIDRPGDVWDYVSVAKDQVPEIVSRQINDARQKSKHPWEEHYPWSETCVPFSVFDKFFIYMGDDTLPPDEAWRNQRNSPVMMVYARQLL